MEAIFLDATGLPSTHRAGQGATTEASRIEPRAPRRPFVSATTLGALAAVVLAGLSAGAVMVSRQGATPAPVAPPAALARAATSPSNPPSLVVTAAPEVATTTVELRPFIAASAPPRRPAHTAGATRSSHADLMVADRRLRRAYARAVSAGVPRPILVEYRNRWDDLRHEANWRPDRVRVGYDTMAQDLTRMSTSPHHRRASRSSR